MCDQLFPKRASKYMNMVMMSVYNMSAPMIYSSYSRRFMTNYVSIKIYMDIRMTTATQIIMYKTQLQKKKLSMIAMKIAKLSAQATPMHTVRSFLVKQA